MTERGSSTSRTTSDSAPSGPDFNRHRWSSIQAAPTTQATVSVAIKSSGPGTRPSSTTNRTVVRSVSFEAHEAPSPTSADSPSTKPSPTSKWKPPNVKRGHRDKSSSSASIRSGPSSTSQKTPSNPQKDLAPTRLIGPSRRSRRKPSSQESPLNSNTSKKSKCHERLTHTRRNAVNKPSCLPTQLIEAKGTGTRGEIRMAIGLGECPRICVGMSEQEPHVLMSTNTKNRTEGPDGGPPGELSYGQQNKPQALEVKAPERPPRSGRSRGSRGRPRGVGDR